MGNCCAKPPPRNPGGRPYVVNSGVSQPNVTEHTSDNSWSYTSLNPNITSLTPEERTTRAAMWTELGKSEHASIASFALFAQKLLAIGAPSHLINEAFKCAQEETTHASFAFTLASAYAGHTISPSTYNTHTMTVKPDLLEIIEGTIKEGCVQETVSALEARRQILEEDDPEVKRVWEKVVEDEAHHAAYAWKVVKWAIEKDGKPNKQILDMMDAIFTPTSLKQIIAGQYSNEDIKLLCTLKDTLLQQYDNTNTENQERPLLFGGEVGRRVMEEVVAAY